MWSCSISLDGAAPGNVTTSALNDVNQDGPAGRMRGALRGAGMAVNARLEPGPVGRVVKPPPLESGDLLDQ